MSKWILDEVDEGLSLLDLWPDNSKKRSIFLLGTTLILFAVFGFFYSLYWRVYGRRKWLKGGQ